MKRLFTFLAVWTAGMGVCAAAQQGVAAGKEKVYTVTENMRFPEGTLVLRSGEILVANFGTDSLAPLNREGRGYIVSLNKENRILIPARGALNAPKGMAVKEDCLFVADVGCVTVFHLKKPGVQPVKIAFPEGEVFVNDIVAMGDFLLVSVTNTGHIYALDVRDCEAVWGARRPVPKLVATIPGANGLAEYEGTLYVASYDPEERPGAENGIYAVNMTDLTAEPVNLMGDRFGQYDGVAVSGDGKRLYFSNWRGENGSGEVGFVDLTPEGKNAVTVLDLGVELWGPADISVAKGYLVVPDLPASRVYMVAL